ncbi:hypothetical protein STA3757_44470 [Stanieria sp. NIES-3757]|nr:hypothetical protein STA3757_44470 [Stanieria sp. NIES-3757]
MRTSSQNHLGQSIAFAAVLALMSIGVILLMTLESGVF